MDVDRIDPKGRQVIQSYGAGGFQVSGERHSGSLLVFADHTVAWAVSAHDQLTLAALAPVAAARPKVEILLLGTGARMVPVGAALRRELRELGITLDVMDTGAACRTFNVLSAEERRVAAAQIAVG
jgi:uncharacterized protein